MEISIPNSEEEFQKLFEKACTFHQENNFEKADKLYAFLLELLPDSILILYNYGLLNLENSHYEKAANLYKKAAKLSPENTDVLYNYALSLKHCGALTESIGIYKRILTLTPDDLDSHYNLGCCYKDNGESELAISAYKEVLQRQPDHPPTLNNIAYLYHKSGELEKAKDHYKHLITRVPDHRSAGHMLASLEGSNVHSAPAEYVKEVFDTYSNHYEHSLINELQYDVPNLMHSHFLNLYPNSISFSKGLDLGCGTGLAGTVFHKYCESLTGVDISAKMLSLAEDKGLYENLVAMDIIEFLKIERGVYDFIIAADVFTYLGSLEEIFQALSEKSSPQAKLCFSVETSYSAHFELRKTGRFAHSSDYIKKLSVSTGWQCIGSFKENLRKEKGEWIKGTIFFLQKE
jgi:predicted TPR repeat methyltransferase